MTTKGASRNICGSPLPVLSLPALFPVPLAQRTNSSSSFEVFLRFIAVLELNAEQLPEYLVPEVLSPILAASKIIKKDE